MEGSKLNHISQRNHFAFDAEETMRQEIASSYVRITTHAEELIIWRVLIPLCGRYLLETGFVQLVFRRLQLRMIQVDPMSCQTANNLGL
mmetsp:Transcript_50258/g.157057  ORF Transcript_50258/g.157057 Transcript_50258/m.157057 type:complete len:89 (+) Transcript_50258:56-322(+)